MLRFYWELVKRIPDLLWSSAGRLDKIIGLSSLGLTVLGVTPLWPFSASWALLPLGLLFVYGLMKANYEAFREVERERDEERRLREALERTWADRERRKALKLALQHAALEGKLLHDDEPTKERAQDWENRVAVMIWVALDAGEVGLFYNDFDVSVDPVDEDSEVKRAIRRRLKLLYELIRRVDSNSTTVNPDFYANEWMGHRPPRINVTSQAQEVFRRAGEIQNGANQQ